MVLHRAACNWKIASNCVYGMDGYSIRRRVIGLPYNNGINAGPPRSGLLGWFGLIQINVLPSPSPDVHILQSDNMCFVPELVHNHKQDKNRDQDIVNHKVSRAKRIEEASVPLEENEEHICCQREVGAPWVEESLEWELWWVLALRDQGFPESNMRNSDYRPNNEGSNCTSLAWNNGVSRNGSGGETYPPKGWSMPSKPFQH